MSSNHDTSSLGGKFPLLTARTAQGSEVRVKIIVSRKRKRGVVDAGQQPQPPAMRGRPCHCKRNNCLKLYCVCFQFGVYCDGAACVCVECKNVKGQPERREVILKLLNRNSDTFRRPSSERQQKQAATPAVSNGHQRQQLAPSADRMKQAWRLETQQLGHLFHTLRQEAVRGTTTAQGATAAPKKLYRKLKTHMEQLVHSMEEAERIVTDAERPATAAASGDQKPPPKSGPTKDSVMSAKAIHLPDSVFSSIEINVGTKATEFLPESNSVPNGVDSFLETNTVAANAAALPGSNSVPANSTESLLGSNTITLRSNGVLKGESNEKDRVKADAKRELNILASQDVALLTELTAIIKQKTQNITKVRKKPGGQASA